MSLIIFHEGRLMADRQHVVQGAGGYTIDTYERSKIVHFKKLNAWIAGTGTTPSNLKLYRESHRRIVKGILKSKDNSFSVPDDLKYIAEGLAVIGDQLYHFSKVFGTGCDYKFTVVPAVGNTYCFGSGWAYAKALLYCNAKAFDDPKELFKKISDWSTLVSSEYDMVEF